MPNQNGPAPVEGEAVECLPASDIGDHSTGQHPAQFSTPRDAALALLQSGARLTRKAGSFLGQCAVDPTPLTPAQADWLATLLERAELPPLKGGAE